MPTDICKIHGPFVTDKIEAKPQCPKCLAATPPRAELEWFSVAGQDLARYRDYSAYVSLKIVDGVARVKRLYVWPHVKYEVVMSETMRFLTLDRVRSFCVDTTNDSKVGEDYQSMGAPISPMRFTAPGKQELVEYFRDASGKGLVKLPTKGPFVQQLKTELAEQERIVSLNKEVPHFAHPSGQHDDLFWSLMLAVRAAAPWLTAKVFVYMAKHEPRQAETNMAYRSGR